MQYVSFEYLYNDCDEALVIVLEAVQELGQTLDLVVRSEGSGLRGVTHTHRHFTFLTEFSKRRTKLPLALAQPYAVAKGDHVARSTERKVPKLQNPDQHPHNRECMHFLSHS
jgi:hypothetical protein